MKLIKAVLAVMALAVVSLFIIILVIHSNKYDTIRNLPHINLTTSDNLPYNTKDLYNKGKPAVIIVFHPECEYCIIEAREILSKREILSNIQLLFVTSADGYVLSDFLDEYPLDSLPDATVAMDTNMDFMKIFGIKGPPVSIVYDSSMRLKKIFNGLTDVGKIAPAVVE